jgi:5-methylcytosine-specific restriction enzyme subunit McrC
MSRTLEVFEHGKLPVTASGDGLRPLEFDELVRFNDRYDGRYFEVGHKHLKATSYVGYVEVGDVAIEVLPKADKHARADAQVWREGLLEMLQVSLGLRLASVSDASQRLSRSRLLDLIAQAFVAEVSQLLREGLAKGYRTTQSNGVVFRGRLRMADHLRENLARADRFFVEYQTFDHQIPVNQVVAAALEALSWRALSPGVAAAVEGCLVRFPEVSTAGVTGATFDRIRLNRATERYAKALVYARMILAHQGPKLQSGGERVFALLFDMNALWERYVATLMRRAAPAGVRVVTQERHHFWVQDEHRVRRVKPDIVVRTDDEAATTLLVIDTKWKVPTKAGLPSDDDLQQMFVYNELLDSAHAVLLYPRTAASVAASGTYATTAHTCRQVYLGRFEDAAWRGDVIRAELAALLAGLIGSTS